MMEKAKSLLFSMLVVACMLAAIPTSVRAMSSTCVSALHKQALSDAINLTPEGLKNILKPLESKMLDRVSTIQGRSANDRVAYEAAYKTIGEILSDRDQKRQDYLARMLAEITIYPLLKYSPIRSYDTCDYVRIIKEASVIFDGYDESPDYSKMTYADFTENSVKYEEKREIERMTVFYNLLVNEIADLWSNVWIHVGNKADDMPMAGSVIKEGVIKKNASNRIQPLASNPSQHENTAVVSFSDSDLIKHKNPSDAVANNAIEQHTGNATEKSSDPECSRLNEQIRNTRISTGRGFYSDMLSVNNAMLQYRLRCQKTVARSTQNSVDSISAFGPGYITNGNIFPQQQKSKAVYGNDQMLYSDIKESGCSSDFSCGMGYKCVKAPLKSKGECMKEVDKYGLPTYRAPSLDSIGPNMNKNGCNFNTDCPIGYHCDKKYKLCAK